MMNDGYLELLLSLFTPKIQKTVKYFAGENNNTLNTTILAYVFYSNNLLPYCVSGTIDNNAVEEFTKDFNKGTTLPEDTIIVSPECCVFADKLKSFRSKKALRHNRNQSDLTISYIVYIFLTDKSFDAYNLFQKCLGTKEYNYALTTLQNTLLQVVELPTNPVLLQYGKFLTNPFTHTPANCYGRDVELSTVLDVLSRKKKNNPVLIGQPGVGKTTIVEGLAELLMSDKCPKRFEGYHVYEASLSTMLAGSRYRGDFEERFDGVLKAIIESGTPIILFIDEIHTIMNGSNSSEGSTNSSGMSACEILKPYLGRSGLLLIGATTEQEYRIIEKDKALSRRFSPIHIKEPSDIAVEKLLAHVIPEYQNHFSITIPEEHIPQMVKYAHEYIPNRYMPDKVLDLLDGACVHCTNHRDDKTLSLVDIINSAELLAGVKIPSQNSSQVCVQVQDILKTLSDRIIGQPQAINELSSVLKRYFLGFSNENKPIGSFLFVGPTGVGKTQLCKELAYSLFTRESFIRFDMSEFMESHAVSKLIGSPPGYVGFGTGGLLTNAVKHNPYSVVLFDEIEKAHPDIYNILLQVLDDGTLTDSEGFTVSFNNCIIVLTSNTGSSDVAEKSGKSIGFDSTGLSTKDITHIYESAVKRRFKPEFLNRLDKIVYFNSLTEKDIKTIVNNELSKVVNKFKHDNITINIPPNVKNYLYEKCYAPEYGARYAQRLITSEIVDSVINYLVDNNLKVDKENKIHITFRKNGNVLRCEREQALV